MNSTSSPGFRSIHSSTRASVGTLMPASMSRVLGLRPFTAHNSVKLMPERFMSLCILGARMKVPLPCFFSTRPSSTKSPTARRTVMRLMPYFSASSSSVGRRLVASNAPP